MGYKIVYNKPPRKHGLLWLSFGFFLLFALCVRILFPEFTQLLLAGKLTAAAAAMADQVAAGMKITDAVQAFCQELLNGT